MTRGERAPRGRAGRVRGVATAACVLCLAGSAGCAEVSQHHRDTLVRTRTERQPTSGWAYVGQGELVRDAGGAVTAVRAAASKDRACRITDIRTVDRTVVTERTMQNQRRSRWIAYTMGSLGAAGAVTNVAAAVLTTDDGARDVLTALGTVGAFLSVSLITMIVREFTAIDTESHVGLVELPEVRHGRCDAQAPAGVRVRLLRTRDAAIAEGVASPDGTVTLPVDGASLQGDAVYALEVDGVVVSHIELPGARPAAAAPAVATPP